MCKLDFEVLDYYQLCEFYQSCGQFLAYFRRYVNVFFLKSKFSPYSFK